MPDKGAPADVLGLLVYTLENINLYFTSLGKDMWMEQQRALTCIDCLSENDRISVGDTVDDGQAVQNETVGRTTIACGFV